MKVPDGFRLECNGMIVPLGDVDPAIYWNGVERLGEMLPHRFSVRWSQFDKFMYDVRDLDEAAEEKAYFIFDERVPRQFVPIGMANIALAVLFKMTFS